MGCLTVTCKDEGHRVVVRPLGELDMATADLLQAVLMPSTGRLPRWWWT